MKIKNCVVCGKEFDGRGICCSPECSFKYKQEYAKKYKEEHREEIAKYQRQKSRERYMPSLNDVPKKSPKPKAKDPEWILQYLQADRLTKISMLAIALTDYQIQLMTYGQLSTLWGTAKYDDFERQVFKRKRSEYANNSSKKNSTTSKNRPKNI